MLQTFRHLLSLIRFSHTLFALPFALLAALMAWRGSWVDKYVAKVVTPSGSTREVITDPKIFFDFGDVIRAGRRSGFITLEETEARINDMTSGWELLAHGFEWRELLGILLCMVFARSAAMAFNRLVDRQIDAANPRTAGRHLPAGLLSVFQVNIFTLLCIQGFIASTLLFLPNWLPLVLSVPVLAWLFGYSYAKRFTSLAHFWLGAALGMSPIAAWIAIRGEAVLINPFDLGPAAVLGAAVLAWVGGFDILYACQDYEYDKSVGLRSVPAKLGVRGALRLAAICHAAAVVLLAAVPLAYPPFGMVYWCGVAAVAGLLIYEHSLVRPDDLARVNQAFFHVNAVISVGLLAVGTIDLLI